MIPLTSVAFSFVRCAFASLCTAAFVLVWFGMFGVSGGEMRNVPENKRRDSERNVIIDAQTTQVHTTKHNAQRRF